ncbi:MAG: hypothetical protein MUF73_04665 [Rhodobacteraceae bacterium]|jgi:hypothetical protein|nr:hypothetical protein [Paracoccaceae bacterium]
MSRTPSPSHPADRTVADRNGHALAGSGQSTPGPGADARLDVLVVAQDGRLGFEALILASSLRQSDPGFSGRLIIAEPQPGGAWPGDPRLAPAIRQELERLGAEVRPFSARHFGASYPRGNKIEALLALSGDRPVLFLDTDTLVTGPLSAVPFDPARPTASMHREGTWPRPTLYGPDMAAIWASLYARRGLDMAPTLDMTQPEGHWERFLYFNAGWVWTGAAPRRLAEDWLSVARMVRDDPPPELVGQVRDPWLDQIALPLAIAAQGGGRPGPELAAMDGAGRPGGATCHWRSLSLLYAREDDRVLEVLHAAVAPNRIKKLLKDWPPARRMIWGGDGARARALFDRTRLPLREQAIRQRLKAAGLWLR